MRSISIGMLFFLLLLGTRNARTQSPYQLILRDPGWNMDCPDATAHAVYGFSRIQYGLPEWTRTGIGYTLDIPGSRSGFCLSRSGISGFSRFGIIGSHCRYFDPVTGLISLDAGLWHVFPGQTKLIVSSHARFGWQINEWVSLTATGFDWPYWIFARNWNPLALPLLRFQVQIDPCRKLNLLVLRDHSENGHVQWEAHCQLHYKDQLTLRFGMALNPVIIRLGVSYMINGSCLDFQLLSGSQLGMTPTVLYERSWR